VSVGEHRKQGARTVACAILTVSDTRTPDTDTSGALASDLLVQGGHRVVARTILPDEPARVRAQVEEWLAASEIEAIVGALPEVSLAAVIARADPKWGERPVLLVELREGAVIDDAALLAALTGKVAPWWIPDTLLRLEKMPLASTGKIDKMQLRSEYGSG